MTGAVTLRPRARLDLLEQFIYLGEHGGVEVAERYFAAVEESCAVLVKQPRSGAPFVSGIERLAGLRRAPVRGFGNDLLFYMPHAASIEIVRVLHSARDIQSVFGGDENQVL